MHAFQLPTCSHFYLTLTIRSRVRVSLLQTNNTMKIQRSTPQLQCSTKFARAPGHHASILYQPRSKRDLPALRKLTATLKKKKSKKTSYFKSYIMGLVSMQSAKKAVSGKEGDERNAALAMETISENIADEGVKVRRCQTELQSSLDGQYWTMQPSTGRAGRKRKQTVFFSPSC